MPCKLLLVCISWFPCNYTLVLLEQFYKNNEAQKRQKRAVYMNNPQPWMAEMSALFKQIKAQSGKTRVQSQKTPNFALEIQEQNKNYLRLKVPFNDPIK